MRISVSPGQLRRGRGPLSSSHQARQFRAVEATLETMTAMRAAAITAEEPVRLRAPNQKLQLLGLAFCASDLAFEIDRWGLVTLAIGAAEQLTGASAADMQGLHWSDLMGPDETDLLAAMLENLRPGERQGPMRVSLAPRRGEKLDRFANLSVFRLPENGGNLSCALSLGGAPTAAVTRHAGLLDRASFEAATAAAIAEAAESGSPVRLALVQLGGLSHAMSGLDASLAADARRKIAAAMRLESQGGLGASEIADERFALVRSASGSEERLVRRIRQICGEAVTPVTAELLVGGAAPEQGLRAVRYALDRYISGGAGDAADSFEAMFKRTAEESVKFRAALTSGAFHLVYQPVVQLGDHGLHHHEALTRFEGTESPAAAIQLAEELGMIMDLDYAVAKTVVGVLADADARVKIAANISAVSLMNPQFLASLVALTASAPKLRPRLLFEITETQKLENLADAARVVATLRELGHPICLDDFGAGAATLEYLSRLEVDLIKFDGRYIKSLDRRPRDSAVIKHVAALCRELGIGTIAEMIETEEVAAVARRLGVAMGQGWLYGKPTLTIRNPVQAEAAAIRPALVHGPAAARRKGATESWG
jgi:EAL domain-containing protein (putative c-di-GMP-specific phosphodiesterase class I)